jgi:uncharacterized protein (DUF1330 family)
MNVRDIARYLDGPRPLLIDLLEKKGGHIIAASMNATMITGGPMEGNRTVICEFSSLADIEQWVGEAEKVQKDNQDIFEFVRLGAVPEHDEEQETTQAQAQQSQAPAEEAAAK